MKDFHEGSYYVMTIAAPDGKTAEVAQCYQVTNKHVTFAVKGILPNESVRMLKNVYGHDAGLYMPNEDALCVADANETDWQGSPLSICRFEEGNVYRLHAAGAGIGYGQQLAVCTRVTPDFMRMSTPGHTLTFKKRGTDASCNDHEYIRAARGNVEYYASASEVTL